MAEIIKVYRQSIPAMRFIGKNYGNSENTDWGAIWSDAFSSDIFGKVERASGGENESHLLYEDSDAYIGLCYRNEETGNCDAWIGMFAPIGTRVDIGLDYIDFPQQNLGVCWIYGAYAAPTVQPDRRRWCIVTAGMVHGDRRCGAPGRHAENYSGMPLRLRMDSPSIWMV